MVAHVNGGAAASTTLVAAPRDPATPQPAGGGGGAGALSSALAVAEDSTEAAAPAEDEGVDEVLRIYDGAREKLRDLPDAFHEEQQGFTPLEDEGLPDGLRDQLLTSPSLVSVVSDQEDVLAHARARGVRHKVIGAEGSRAAILVQGQWMTMRELEADTELQKSAA